MIRSRAQVTELSKQRSDEIDDANHRKGATTKVWRSPRHKRRIQFIRDKKDARERQKTNPR